MDKFYQTAEKLVANDKFADAISLYIKSIENGNYDSSYALATIYLDCYEDLGLKKPNYLEALKYLKLGAQYDHDDCIEELLKIYSNDQIGFFNYSERIEFLLRYNKFNKEIYNSKIVNFLKYIYNLTSKHSIESMLKTINNYEKYKKITTNNNIITKINSYRNILIINCANLIIISSNTLEELKEKFELLNKYYTDKLMVNVNNKFLEKMISFILKDKYDVLYVVDFIDTIKKFNVVEANISKIDDLYLYVADSYRNGTNGVNVNIDISIEYYKKVNNSAGIIEVDKYFSDLCNESICNENYEEANKYAFLIKSYNKKIEMYEKIFTVFKNKKIFDLLIHNINIDHEKLRELLIKGKEYKIQFSESQKKLYEEVVRYYDTNDYTNICASNLKHIEQKKNFIYHFFDYYKKAWVEKYPNNIDYRNNYDTFISIKKGTYNHNTSNIDIITKLYDFFILLKEDFIICTVPGHEQTKNISNGVFKILKQVKINQNLIIRNTLIQRKHTVEKKAISNNLRDYKIDMESLTIEFNFDVKNKKIVVIDDITTTGSSLIACKNILMDAGAANVVLLAFGKTKEMNYGFK